jgi:hypothetical protein
LVFFDGFKARQQFSGKLDLEKKQQGQQAGFTATGPNG